MDVIFSVVHVVLVLLPELVLLSLAAVWIHRWVSAPRLGEEAQQVRRQAGKTTTLLVLLLVVAFVLTPTSQEPRLSVFPALLAMLLVAVAAWRDTAWPAQRGNRRYAGLFSGDRADDRLRRLWLGASLTAAALLVAGGLTADPSGTRATRTFEGTTVTYGPYPGWHFGVPLLVALAVLAAATVWAERRVAGRPTIDGVSPEVDRLARDSSLLRVHRVAALGALTTLAGVAFAMGPGINGVTQELRMHAHGAPLSPGDWVQNLGFAVTGIGVLAVVLILLALSVSSPWDRRRSEVSEEREAVA